MAKVELGSLAEHSAHNCGSLLLYTFGFDTEHSPRAEADNACDGYSFCLCGFSSLDRFAELAKQALDSVFWPKGKSRTPYSEEHPPNPHSIK